VKPYALHFLLCVLAVSTVQATPVRFRDVEPTFFSGKKSALLRVIDGVDAGREGWSVEPEVSKPQSSVFIFKEPVVAGRLRLSLCFLSGQPNAHFNEFALSVTSDPAPYNAGYWEPLVPWLAYSTGTRLETRPFSRLHSKGAALNTEFVIESLIDTKPITGLRLEVFPVQSSPEVPEGFVSESAKHDFLLTEFRVEAFDTESTNVALGTPVRASHTIWGPFRPEFLTDGLPATFAHPREPNLGEQFFFEIDLGRIRSIDHLTLRGRGDGQCQDRLSKLLFAFYDEPPGTDLEPVWRGTHREDGSYPALGSTDVIRADAGRGTFRGRYLRISSNSPIAHSPQLAEVEVYESLTAELVAIRADGQNVPLTGGTDSQPVEIPPGARWLAFSIQPGQKHLPKTLPLRWRLNGIHTEWHSVRADGTAEGACPPPGEYELEAQVGHTDGEWSQATLHRRLHVQRHWWMERPIQLGALGGIFIAAVWGIRHLARHRLTLQLRELERLRTLDKERARIARDMHDVVGSRLTQLSVMHDIFAKEHALSTSAIDSLHRLSGTAREAIAALDEVVWTVNPRNDSLANLADYLCHCASEYLQPLEIRCHQDVPIEWDPRQVQAQTRHEILLAFKEALQNVAKHAVATEVLLTLRHEGGIFRILLEDNGRGLPADLLGCEKDGLSNMTARLAGVGGTCRISAGKNGGTSVLMEVPM
jgi:signal transduction histidine kinase